MNDLNRRQIATAVFQIQINWPCPLLKAITEIEVILNRRISKDDFYSLNLFSLFGIPKL